MPIQLTLAAREEPNHHSHLIYSFTMEVYLNEASKTDNICIHLVLVLVCKVTWVSRTQTHPPIT